MERIKKALEKASQQREDALGSQILKPERASEFTQAKIDDIKYQQTKSVTVTDATLKHNRVVAASLDDSHADIFKILRTKIIQRMRANNWSVLAVTSPTAGAGKSFMSSNIAVSMAMDANYSVLLADLDLRRPSIHKYFGLEAGLGIRDYFEGGKSISELLIHPEIDSLVILPAGKPIRRSSELLSTPKMQALASEFKDRYHNRIVIIDLPPLLHTDDAMMFMPNVNACVLVVAEGENSEDEIKRSIQMIDETKFMGCILNKSTDVQTEKYYY